MQKNLSQGAIGRVFLDHNTAVYFLDKFGSKQSRQIRMIRNIDYPMEYYLAHVSHDVTPLPTRSPNETNYSEEQRFKRKQELSRCGKNLKELSVDLVAVAKETAKEQLIPAEVRLSANVFSNCSPILTRAAVQDEHQCICLDSISFFKV